MRFRVPAILITINNYIMKDIVMLVKRFWFLLFMIAVPVFIYILLAAFTDLY